MTPRIDRGFQRIDAGLIHYREAGRGGGGLPLVLIHGGPGSSAGLVPLIAVLAMDRWVIAPDLMGNGDSDQPPVPQTSIVLYAEWIGNFLTALGIERCDFYGHHSGAQIACELAIAQPARVNSLVLDGVALFAPEQRAEFAERYAPPIVPTEGGEHLRWVWDFASNLTRFFPYYSRDDAHRIIPAASLSPDAVTRIVVEMLQVWPAYHLLYKAAFAHDLAERLPLIAAPTLLLKIIGDPLAKYAEHAAALVPGAGIVTSTREQRAQAVAAFLADSDAIVSE